jgi:hypothetical protein
MLLAHCSPNGTRDLGLTGAWQGNWDSVLRTGHWATGFNNALVTPRRRDLTIMWSRLQCYAWL